MPTLLVEHFGRRSIAHLSRRVIIGRVVGAEIRIPERSVSRIHAWIAPEGEDFYITDAGSRFGSRLNGQLFQGRVRLKDGDLIRIGPAKMRFREKTSVPEGFELIHLEDAARQRPDEMIDCVCGAPLWAPWDYAGRMGQCRYCGKPVKGSAAPQKAPAAVATGSETCGACHSEIAAGEAITHCPDCGVSFHANCWAENLGCSSYGCKQVGILDLTHGQPPVEARPLEALSLLPAETSVARPVDWSYPILAATVGSALAGLLAFGIPPALCLIGIIAYRARSGAKLQRGLLVASALIAIVFTGAGAAFSWYWWFAGRIGTKVALL